MRDAAALQFELLEPTQLISDLQETIPQARRRFALISMVGLWDEQTAPIFQDMADAAARGVDTYVGFDAYSTLPINEPLGVSTARHKERLGQTKRGLAAIKANGGEANIIGKIGINPYAGRCHVKAVVADDTVWSFGGIGFHKESFARKDYFLKVNGPNVADQMFEWTKSLITHQELEDQEVAVRGSANTSLLLDGGKPGRSIIYDRACELAEDASSIVFVSQLPPSGRLSRLIARTKHEVYFNRPNQLSLAMRLSQISGTLERRDSLANQYTGSEYLHAKYILYTLRNGQRIALSGSHNYKRLGVRFGTQEVALQSAEESVWNALSSFTEKRVR